EDGASSGYEVEHNARLAVQPAADDSTGGITDESALLQLLFHAVELRECFGMDDGIHVHGGTDSFHKWVGKQQPGGGAPYEHDLLAQVAEGKCDRLEVGKIGVRPRHREASEHRPTGLPQAPARGPAPYARHRVVPGGDARPGPPRLPGAPCDRSGKPM